MSSHRYWRAVGMRTYAGDMLEVSAFKLCDGNTPLSDTPTANVPPDAGSLANLTDGSVATTARWARAYGLILHWDLGTPTEVNNVQLGSADDIAKFPLILSLEWSDDDTVWKTHRTFAGIVWPGARRQTANAAQREQYPHWRVLITANNGGPLTAIQEIELRSFAGGADVTRPGMVTGESSYYAPDGAIGAKAFDDDYFSIVAGSWVSSDAAVPQWVSINLTFSASVAEVLIAPQRYSGGTERAPKDFSVQASLDGTDWVTVASFSGVTDWVYTDAKIFTIPIPTELSISRGFIRGAAQPNRIAPIYVGGEIPSPGLVAYEPPMRALRNFLVDRDAGTISGTVKEKNLPDNTPLKRRVRLYRERDGALVQETWSDSTTGAYVFLRVDTLERYTVLAYDYKHNYRATVADNLVPT